MKARSAAARARRAPLVAHPNAALQLPLIAIECLDTEQALRLGGYRAIAGVDEVGRGSWAGPVYAAAVVLPPECYDDRALLREVTDSKLLSAAKRERLVDDIVNTAVGAAVGWVQAPVVDRVNVLGATRLAMAAALRALAGSARLEGHGWAGWRLTPAPVQPDYLLADAVRLPDVPLPQQAVIKGDRSCLAIAAASIVAKVHRDAEMCRLAPGYPDFGFERNKGYGTARHLAALRGRGLTPLHRRTFAPMKYLLGVRDFVAGSLPAACR